MLAPQVRHKLSKQCASELETLAAGLPGSYVIVPSGSGDTGNGMATVGPTTLLGCHPNMQGSPIPKGATGAIATNIAAATNGTTQCGDGSIRGTIASPKALQLVTLDEGRGGGGSGTTASCGGGDLISNLPPVDGECPTRLPVQKGGMGTMEHILEHVEGGRGVSSDGTSHPSVGVMCTGQCVAQWVEGGRSGWKGDAVKDKGWVCGCILLFESHGDSLGYIWECMRNN